MANWSATFGSAVVLASLATSAFAQSGSSRTTNITLDEVSGWGKPQYWSYQQKQFAIEDAAGDLILTRMLSNFPFDAVLLLTGQKMISIPTADVAPHESSGECRSQGRLDHTCVERGWRPHSPDTVYVEGTEPAFRQPELLRAFVRVIQEEERRTSGALRPHISPAPRWSEEFLTRFTNKRAHIPGNPHVTEDYGYIVDLFDKPLVALFFGSTSRFMTVGTEDELVSWIVSQPFNSATLIDVFRKSYRMHDGDLHHTFLSVENILSRHWRHKYRENLPMTRRLRPFTNWKDGVINDNFGSWYHFWGVAYYGVIAGKRKAVFAAQLEHQGSVILSHDSHELQEKHVNLQGAKLGGELRSLVLSGAWRNVTTRPEDTQEASYRNVQTVYP